MKPGQAQEPKRDADYFRSNTLPVPLATPASSWKKYVPDGKGRPRSSSPLQVISWEPCSCGSPLISTRDTQADTLLLRAGCIDRGADTGPVAHGWVAFAAPWHRITDDLPQFERGFPGSPPGVEAGDS